MKRNALAVASTLIMVLFTMPSLQAQDAPAGLVGTWALSVSDSEFSSLPEPDSVFVTIDRADDRLEMRRDLHYSKFGHTFIMYAMPIDGGIYEATTTDGRQEVSVSWDGSVLMMIREIGTDIVPVELTERLGASDDGRTLTLDRLIDVPGKGVMKSSLVFRRRD